MERLRTSIAEAKSALTDKPLFATSAERIAILDEIKSTARDLPQPLRFSRFLSILLSRVSVPVAPHDRIAGRCVDRELTPEEEAAFQAYRRHPDCPQGRVLLSSGHCTYDWDFVLSEGLPGMWAKAEASLAAQTDAEKRIFLQALIEIYGTIAAYMRRYADAAEAAGLAETAQALRRGSAERPGDFRTALQLLWIITLIDCAYITPNPTLTVGRLDQLLYPFYTADLAAGRITRDEAKAWIADYYCKHNLIMGRGEHQVGDEQNSTTFARICNFDAPQYLMLAGTDDKGKPAVNDLTCLFAEAIEPAFKNPVIVVRYYPGLDREHPGLWKTLTEKSLASASLMYYNDANVLSTYARLGLPEADARQYSHFGCNWPTPGPDSAWVAGGPSSRHFHAYRDDTERRTLGIPYIRNRAPHSWPEDLLLVLRELAERETVTMDDICSGFFSHMAAFMEHKLAHCAHEIEVRQRRPSAALSFGDCFFPRSVETGVCFSAGAKYKFDLMPFQMFGTVVDCFTVIDRLVFTEKVLTLTELLAAVDADFVGHEAVLARIRAVPRYGSDDPVSNAWVGRLARRAAELTAEMNAPYLREMGLFLVPCLQSDTWHLKYGEDFGATPDGRRANTPFSQNARPANGAAVNGLTAMFNAMLHIPADGYLSGALNLDIDPKQFAGETGRAAFAALLGVYFNRGGLHAQVTAVSAEDLAAARLDPDRHRDIRVRVTGYSGVFVDICERLQDDIIERFR